MKYIFLICVGLTAALFWSWLFMLSAGALGLAKGFWAFYPLGYAFTMVIMSINASRRRW